MDVLQVKMIQLSHSLSLTQITENVFNKEVNKNISLFVSPKFTDQLQVNEIET